MRLDFPTLERPINAYSGLVSLGHFDTVGAEMQNSDFLIIIMMDGDICVWINAVRHNEWLAHGLSSCKDTKKLVVTYAT